MHYTIDIETSGLEINSDINFVGAYALETDCYHTFQIPQQKAECIAFLESIKGEELIYHNGKFDTKLLKYSWGIELPIVHDTLVLAYLTSDVPTLFKAQKTKDYFSLKGCAKRELGVSNWDISTKQKTSKDPNLVIPYLKLDVFYTAQVFNVLSKRLPKEVYKTYKLIMHSLNVYRDVEVAGMPINLDALEPKRKEIQAMLQETERQFANFSRINWRSAPQLQHYLYEELGLPVLKYTDKGLPSTDKYTLTELLGKHPVIEVLQTLRDQHKMLQFLTDWKKRAINGRIHASYNLANTVTGRTSCSEPNLQQVPRGKILKSLFQSTDPEWEFVQCDYSQAELRFASIVADVQAIKSAYRNGEDLHINMAANVAGKSRDKVTKEERTAAKASNFGYIYGMQAKSFVSYAKQSYGVVISEEMARDIRATFFAENHELRPYYSFIEQKLLNDGCITSIMGRRYWTGFEIFSSLKTRSDYIRKAINFTVQSTSSDYVLCGLIEIHKRLPKDEVQIIGSVHDSVLMLVRKNPNFRKNLELIQQIMQEPQLAKRYLNPDYPIDIPIVVDVEVGPWGMSLSMDEYFKKEGTTHA